MTGRDHPLADNVGETYVVVGAGHAGGRAAAALRREGFAGRLVVIGAETHLPYERPPLSKGLLTGAQQAADCTLQPASFYAEQAIELRLGTRVTAIDRGRKCILAGAAEIGFDKLLLATGGDCRRLDIDGAALAGIHTLRTQADSAAIAADLGPGRRLVVIGGGFIGLEVAASAVQRGCDVTVVEVADQLMGRVVPPAFAGLVAAAHASHGVRLLTGARPVGFIGADRVTAVALASGEELAADAVVVGIGIVPATGLAAVAGLAVDNGIVVDAHCRTADADIFAAGDVANFYHPVFERQIRLESWRHAEAHPAVAAQAMLSGGAPYAEIPWLWSDQYDLNMQVSGLTDRYDEVVQRGANLAAGVVCFLTAGGRVVGTCGVGVGGAIGRDVRIAQRLIERGQSVDAAKLADPAFALKQLLRGG